MKYFVQDPSSKQFYYFDSVPKLVKCLEWLCEQYLKLTRAQYTQNLAELGHGTDDPQGVTFTRALAADHFYMGAVKADGQHFRCDVHEANTFSQSEYGN